MIEAFDSVVQAYEEDIEELRQENACLQKENERLRKALRVIRKATYTSDPYYGGADLKVRKLVWEALNKEKNDD